MARISNSATIGRAVAHLASRQHGVASRKQLRRLGLTDDAVLRWLRDGRIHRVQRGVYAIGRADLDAQGRIQAAVLACGAQAIVSHRSAAYLLGIGARAPLVVDVTPPGQRGRAIDGVRFHSVPFPARSELILVDGIPCTDASRTIVDLAGTYGEAQLRDSIERAATERSLDLGAIDAILTAGPRRRGAPCLRRILADWRPVAAKAAYPSFRSLFEAKLLPLVIAAGLTLPDFNVPVRTATRTIEVDLLWPDQRLVLEADSRKHHGIEIAFERDHRRSRELLAAGYTVLRVTWREVEHETPAVFAVLRQELAVP